MSSMPDNNTSFDPDGECRMTDHPNLYNRALTILEAKGFKLFLLPVPDKEDPGRCYYWAVKGGRDFDAEDPLRLLGMIAIWEQYGDDWYHNPKMETKKIMSRLEERAWPDSVEDYKAMSDEDFHAFVKDYREFFQLFATPIILGEQVSRQELYDIISTLNQEQEE